jgi:hypothetical protein
MFENQPHLVSLERLVFVYNFLSLGARLVLQEEQSRVRPSSVAPSLARSISWGSGLLAPRWSSSTTDSLRYSGIGPLGSGAMIVTGTSGRPFAQVFPLRCAGGTNLSIQCRTVAASYS